MNTTVLRAFKPGDVLPDNGATVIAFRPLVKGACEANSAIVLAICGGYHPYVTWIYNRDRDYCHTGHYFTEDALGEAWDDYTTRR